jgi:hypothetical protein
VLIPYIRNDPLISWMYPVFGIRGASGFLGMGDLCRFGGPSRYLAKAAREIVTCGVHPLGWTDVAPFKWRPAGRVPLQT